MNNGLPNTLVFQLSGTLDDVILFAATEIGPYGYSRNDDEWFLISGLSAPDQTYWTVDYIPDINTARFGTYGRGIWDFVLNFRNLEAQISLALDGTRGYIVIRILGLTNSHQSL